MIFRRYFAWFVAVAVALWVPGTALEVWMAYRDGVSSIGAVQSAEASAARRLIEDHLRGIERQVRDVSSLPWSSGVLSEEDRRREFQRLLKIVPAIHEIHRWDADGHETLYVSRVWKDRVNQPVSGSVPPVLPGNTTSLYGDVTFRDGLEPFVPIALRESDAPRAGTVSVLVDLKFVADYIASLRVGQQGVAYLTDRAGIIIAHPDTDLMLRRQSIATSPQFMAMLGTSVPDGAVRALYVGSPAGGRYVSARNLEPTGWHVFVEQPSAEVFRPVREALLRGVVILILGLVVAFGASLWIARRLAGPILEVKRGAERIAQGDLAARIEVKTGDEVQALAEEFNRMAAQLQDYTTGLERKVSEKTTELQGALKLAHDAMRARALFVAAASHDLRQPLYAISILADTIALENLPPASASALGKQREAIAILQTLFDNLLDLSRFDAGEVRVNVRVNSLHEVLVPLVSEYEFLCSAKGLAWGSEIAEVAVKSDPELVRRLVGNLLSNAVRYTRQGGVGLRARVEGSEVEIIVSDTGVGIALEDQARVFEEFVQLGNSERNRDEGVGLGLSIVRRIAELLGAKLFLESTPGKGTRIGFRIPIAEGVAVPIPAPARPEASALGRLSGLRVWIVEDDSVVRGALALQLSALGVRHAFATRRHELETLHHRDGVWPDAVVVDDMLGPHESGLDIAQWLKERMEAERIIVVTGSGDPHRLRALDGSGVRMLRKPVAAGDLVLWLRTVGARSFPAREPAG